MGLLSWESRSMAPRPSASSSQRCFKLPPKWRQMLILAHRCMAQMWVSAADLRTFLVARRGTQGAAEVQAREEKWVSWVRSTLWPTG